MRRDFSQIIIFFNSSLLDSQDKTIAQYMGINNFLASLIHESQKSKFKKH